MTVPRRDATQAVSHQRDALLAGLLAGVPYISYLGIRFDRRGDELTAILPFDDKLIGNPSIPALHGGVTAAFLEVAAIIELALGTLGDTPPSMPMRLPKTIDFTVDYLRPGLAREAYARARINRSGRRYASVHVEAWQDSRTRLFAQGTGHFLMPPASGDPAE